MQHVLGVVPLLGSSLELDLRTLMDLRSSFGERLIQHLDKRRAAVGVRLIFVELHELLDLLADRTLYQVPLLSDHVATLRIVLGKRLLNRKRYVVGLWKLEYIQRRSQSFGHFLSLVFRESGEHVLVDVAPVVTGLDDTDLNTEGSELNSQ